MLGSEPGCVVRSLLRRVQEQESREESDYSPGCGMEARRQQRRPRRGNWRSTGVAWMPLLHREWGTAWQRQDVVGAAQGWWEQNQSRVDPRGPSGLVGAIASAKLSSPSSPHHSPSSFPFFSPPLLLLLFPPTLSLPFFPPTFLSFPS